MRNSIRRPIGRILIAAGIALFAAFVPPGPVFADPADSDAARQLFRCYDDRRQTFAPVVYGGPHATAREGANQIERIASTGDMSRAGYTTYYITRDPRHNLALVERIERVGLAHDEDSASFVLGVDYFHGRIKQRNLASLATASGFRIGTPIPRVAEKLARVGSGCGGEYFVGIGKDGEAVYAHGDERVDAIFIQFNI